MWAFDSAERGGADAGTWRDRTSACASVLMEGMLLPSNVLLLVLILSRSFWTARGEKNHSINWSVLFNICQDIYALKLKKKVSIKSEKGCFYKDCG